MVERIKEHDERFWNRTDNAPFLARSKADSLFRMTGPRYRDSHLLDFQLYHDNQVDVWLQLAEIYLHMEQFLGEGRSIFLHGDSGTGKDLLLTAMLASACMFEPHPKWISGVDARKLEPERNYLPHIWGVSDPVDPGQPPPAWELSKLLRWADYQYRCEMPIWVTLNAVTLDQARDLLGWPLLSRLTENAVVLPCHWPSYRKRTMTTRWTTSLN